MKFTIPGRLRGQGRPRFTRQGHAYKDAKTRTSEGIVATMAMNAMNGRAPLEGPLWLSVAIWLNPPKSWPKKKRRAAHYVTGKPDCSNQVKLLEDACNGILWGDDSQIAHLEVTRRYTDGPERVEIEVGQFGEIARAAA